MDNIEALVATQIPLILVAGTKDKLVPYKHNGAHLYQAYKKAGLEAVSYTHLRAHETVLDLVCRLLLEKKKQKLKKELQQLNIIYTLSNSLLLHHNKLLTNTHLSYN